MGPIEMITANGAGLYTRNEKLWPEFLPICKQKIRFFAKTGLAVGQAFQPDVRLEYLMYR
jgi:hypothetical protein